MGIFGWSLPPGCGTLPGEEPEQPVHLHEGLTLRGYGRHGHGLNGKDADLDYGWQNVIRSALWFSDGTIRVEGRRYASIVPNDGATDEQLALATEIVCGENYAGEWDGDYWVLGEDYSLRGHLDWDDDLDEDWNIARACAYAFRLVSEDSAPFEEAMRRLAKGVEEVTREEA